MISKGVVHRLKEIVLILFEEEMHSLLFDLGLHIHLPFHKKIQAKLKSSSQTHTQPETIVRIFERLGGAFIKLGQLLATRPDLVGTTYSVAFAKLLDDVEPLDPQIVKKSLSHLPITNVNTTPLGSGSVACVYKAKLHNAYVAIKLKRPDIEQRCNEDIQLLHYFAKQIKKSNTFDIVDIDKIIDEFAKYTKQELDFTHEASVMRRFSKHFKNNTYIEIPKVFVEYSSKDILVMEFKEGILANKLKTKPPKQLISHLTQATYKMIFEDGFFHADLHPGNLLIHKNKIILLDYGIVGFIDDALKKKLFNVFSALVEGNIEHLSSSLLDLHTENTSINEIELKEGLYNVLADYYDTSLDNLNFPKMFYDAIDVAHGVQLKLPANLVLFGKSIITMEGFCRKIDPKFNVVTNARPYLKKLYKEQFSPKKIIYESKKFMASIALTLEETPKALQTISRNFSHITKGIEDIDTTFLDLKKEMYFVSLMFAHTILFAVFFLAGILLLDLYPKYQGVSVVSLSCFLLAILFMINIALLKRKFSQI